MNTIFVTTNWDDGQKLDIKLAVPLKYWRIKAISYISAQARQCPRTERLAAKEIRKLAEDFKVGPRTSTHPDPHLDRLGIAARREIFGSKHTLEAIIAASDREAAVWLGDTPAVARASYIHPWRDQRHHRQTCSGLSTSGPRTKRSLWQQAVDQWSGEPAGRTTRVFM